MTQKPFYSIAKNRQCSDLKLASLCGQLRRTQSGPGTLTSCDGVHEGLEPRDSSRCSINWARESSTGIRSGKLDGLVSA